MLRAANNLEEAHHERNHSIISFLFTSPKVSVRKLFHVEQTVAIFSFISFTSLSTQT